MMERLSERFLYYSGILCATGMNVDINDLVHISALLEAEEQGLLLKLPCKVGDTVWDIAGKEIREQIVDGIEHRTDGFFMYANEDEWLGKLGELVFLTKEEAEAKLKELENE